MRNLNATLFFLTLFLLFAFTPFGFGQEEVPVPITQEEFSLFQKRIQDSIANIGNRVNMGGETLNAAKIYSDEATSFLEKLIMFLGVVMAVCAGIFTYLFSRFYNNIKNSAKIYIEGKFKSEREVFNRLIDTEKETIAVKKDTKLLTIRDNKAKRSDPSHNNFFSLKEIISDNFANEEEIVIDDFKELFDDGEKSKSFKKFLEQKNTTKIILMNDQLFDHYITDQNARFKKVAKGKSAHIDKFMENIIKHKIGFASFGDLDLKDFDLPYIAFSNERYSLYTNINNLLKFMLAEKAYQNK